MGQQTITPSRELWSALVVAIINGEPDSDKDEISADRERAEEELAIIVENGGKPEEIGDKARSCRYWLFNVSSQLADHAELNAWYSPPGEPPKPIPLIVEGVPESFHEWQRIVVERLHTVDLVGAYVQIRRREPDNSWWIVLGWMPPTA